MVKEKATRNNVKTGGFIKEMKSHGGLYAMMIPGLLFRFWVSPLLFGTETPYTDIFRETGLDLKILNSSFSRRMHSGLSETHSA